MGNFAYLIMVSELNNNKFYKMTEQPDSTFNVEYGRVDVTSSKTSYPMSKWNSVYNSKVKKGYKDITHLIAIEEVVDTSEENKGAVSFISDDKEVEKLILELKAFATNTIQRNYKVSSQKVTQKMVDEAQSLIDELSNEYKGGSDFEELNKKLLQIYTTIPRRMSDVRDFLFKNNDKKTIEELIDNEQKLLDTMAGQVMANAATNQPIEEATKKESIETNFLEQLGLKINKVNDLEIIKKITELMGESADLMGNVFEVINNKTENVYKQFAEKDENFKEELLWHGSRNQNWFNIIQTGLLIRPSGAVYSGSMFGDGIYFANKARKSIGYTSLNGSYWARGGDNKSFLSIFKVNVGNQKDVHSHSSECYSFSEKTISPYNTVHAHAGRSLMNDEFIVYNPCRCTMKYLVEIKN